MKPQGQRATEKNREELQKQPENNKMVINTYLSMITLNVNELNSQSKDKEWQNGLKNKHTHTKTTTRLLYMSPERDSLQIKGHMQTETKRTEKDILYK